MTDPDGFAGLMQKIEQAEVSPQRAEVRRLAATTRLVIERLVATQAPADVLAGAAEALEAVAQSLAGHPRGRSFEGFAESANAGPGALPRPMPADQRRARRRAGSSNRSRARSHSSSRGRGRPAAPAPSNGRGRFGDGIPALPPRPR